MSRSWEVKGSLEPFFFSEKLGSRQAIEGAAPDEEDKVILKTHWPHLPLEHSNIETEKQATS